MRDLTQSFGRFSWALSLFGFKQLANMLMPESDGASTPGSGRTPAAAFEKVSRAAETELGKTFREIFQVGDQMLRSMVDTMFAWGSPEDWGGACGKGDGWACWGSPESDDLGMPPMAGDVGSAMHHDPAADPEQDLSWVGRWGPMPPAEAHGAPTASPHPMEVAGAGAEPGGLGTHASGTFSPDGSGGSRHGGGEVGAHACGARGVSLNPRRRNPQP